MLTVEYLKGVYKPYEWKMCEMDKYYRPKVVKDTNFNLFL